MKIACATDAIAAERSRFIRDAIANNPRVREVFPHLLPGRPWAADAFTIERPSDVIGPTVAAFGIGAGSTGTRADLLVCDDVVDVRALHSKAERDRAADYFANNLMNLLEPDGRFWGLFTPWHRDDLNARLKRNGAYALFRQPVGADFKPVWPEKWPEAALRARKEEIGSASFARGYQLTPVAAADTPIRAAWLKLWTAPSYPLSPALREEGRPSDSLSPALRGEGRSEGDAAPVANASPPHSRRGESDSLSSALGGEGRGEGCLPHSLAPPIPHDAMHYDKIILSVDPAVSTGTKADRSALVVLGRVKQPDPPAPSPLRDGGWRMQSPEIRVLAARAERLSTPELVHLIDAFDRQWNPAVILFETNAAFQGIKDLLSKHTRFGPRLKGITQSADKTARIAAFSVAVENGAFRLKGNAAGDGPDEAHRELFEEMIAFPYADHDDLVDAAATGCAYLLDRREIRVW